MFNMLQTWTKELKDTNPLMSSSLVICLGWCSNFVGSESDQKQSVKLLQGMVYSTIQHPPPPSHTLLVGSLKMNTTLEYSTRVVQEGDRRCKKSTLNDLAYLTPLRIPLMNPVCLYILYSTFSFGRGEVHWGNSSQAGSKIQTTEWIYLQSIKSVKHNAAKSVNCSILKKSRHIGFGVFIVHSSMVTDLRNIHMIQIVSQVLLYKIL